MTEGQGGGEGTVGVLAQHRAQLSKAIDDDDNAWLESVEGHQVRSGLSLVSVIPMCQRDLMRHFSAASVETTRYLVLIKEVDAQMTSRKWSPGLQFLDMLIVSTSYTSEAGMCIHRKPCYPAPRNVKVSQWAYSIK